MAGKEKVSKKVERSPRNAGKGASPRITRHGNGKPSVRVITAPDKVLGIRTALKKHALSRLILTNEEPSLLQKDYLDALIGFKADTVADQGMTARFIEAVEKNSAEWIKPVHEAFMFAYRLVPDAQYIEYLPGKKLVPNERPKRKQYQRTVQRHEQRYRHAPAGERRQANHRKDRQPKQVVSPGFHVCEKMRPHLKKLADRHDWSNEVRLAAIAHARALTMGTSSINQTGAALNKLGASRARVAVEKCFAATCLYQHRTVRDAILPGMEKNWYRKYYQSAMEMKQRKESRKDNPAAVASVA